MHMDSPPVDKKMTLVKEMYRLLSQEKGCFMVAAAVYIPLVRTLMLQKRCERDIC